MTFPAATIEGKSERTASAENPQASDKNISVVTSNSIFEIEREWRQLESEQIESPGQSYEFISQWIDSFKIPSEDQHFSVVLLDDKPVVIIALLRKNMFGFNVLAPFPGSHVSCGAPLVDKRVMAGLDTDERKKLWRTATAAIKNASLIHFPYVPGGPSDEENIFAQLGSSTPADILYRAEFASWEQCNSEQRTRSRRKHDKQHGAKLNALGDVEFEEVAADSPEAKDIIACMFIQRARRFAVQGIEDVFAKKTHREFYREVAAGKGTLKGVLHVLRLDGEIVAVRYNLLHKNRMFCLISSMSKNENIQTSAPGKQCLLRVMQSVFDNGTRSFDMGAGLTDEKRHWCNIQVPLRHHYVPSNFGGHVLALVLKTIKTVRYWLKNSAKFNAWAKKMRNVIYKLRS